MKWFKKLYFSPAKKQSSSRHATKTLRRFRPQAEALETRETPAVNVLQGLVFVDGPGGTAGVYDATDTPQSGVTVELRNSSNTTVASNTTDVDGYYRFDTTGLPAGQYNIAQTPTFGVNVTAAEAVTLYNTAAVNADKSITVTLPQAAPDPLVVSVLPRAHANTVNAGFKLIAGLPNDTDYYPGYSDYAYQNKISVTGGSGGPVYAANLSTYCVDILHYDRGTYTVTVDGAPVIPSVALAPSGNLTPTSAANAGRISYLYNIFGRFAMPGTPDGLAKEAGLQLAIWEMVYDDYTGIAADANLGLTSGRFQVYTDVTAVSAVDYAKYFLNLAAEKNQSAFFLNATSVNDPSWIQSSQYGGQTFLATELLNFANDIVRPPQTPTASIGDFVWDDLNANGVQDSGEPGVAGVTVTLRDGTGAAVATQPTGTDGKYLFTGLLPGTYSVQFSGLPSGYTVTAADVGPGDVSDSDANILTGGTVTHTLANGEAYRDFDAGIYKPVSVGNLVWEDVNANGVQDSGEPGIAGVSLTLTGTDGLGNAVSATTSTDSLGVYTFGGLVPGTYSVAVPTAPTGYVATATGKGTAATDSNGSGSGTTPAFLASGGSDDTLDFGYYQLAKLGDFVWFDLNANGVQDGGETGIAGVTVALAGTDAFGNAVAKTTPTDANGKYLFTDLVPGSYTVTFPDLSGIGFYRSAANVGADTADSDAAADTGATGVYVLLSGGDNRTVDAGYNKNAITGIKLKDRTGNGKSADDTPLAGTTIYIDVNGSGTLNPGEPTAVTGADGSYLFTGLAAGNYTIREVVPANFLRTYPALSDSYSVALTNGVPSTGNSFVNYEKDCGCSIAGLTNVYYDIYNADGTKRARVTDLRNNVNQGDTVRAYFTVPAGSADAVFTLASYTAPESYFNANTASQQRIFDLDTATFGPGPHTLEVVVPGSNFQIDFVCGYAIDVLGPAGSNIFYTPQCRLISADNDGCAVPGAVSTLSGSVYVDRNNNGLRDVGEPGIGGVTVTLSGTDYLGGTVAKTAVTAADGTYTFAGLKMANLGGYTLTEAQPAAYGDGKDAVGTAGGVLGNDVVSVIRLGAGVNAASYNFGELGTNSISGYVYVDSDNNGIIESDEGGIVGAVITLKNAAGAVVATTVTDDDGFYEFTGLAPGTYSVVETQPFGFYDGKDTVGSLGGTKPANDVLGGIVLGAGSAGINYNFGEIGVSLQSGMTATIGFWNNKNGQNLIKAMPGAALGNWLAANFPNLYADLAGESSASVAAYFKTLFNQTGPKTGAQVLSLALAVFVTNTATNTTTTGRNMACARGFTLSNPGTAAAYVNVGSFGAAFDMDDGTTTTVYQLIRQLDLRSANGVILGAVTNTATRAQQLTMVNTLFTNINEWGDI